MEDTWLGFLYTALLCAVVHLILRALRYAQWRTIRHRWGKCNGWTCFWSAGDCHWPAGDCHWSTTLLSILRHLYSRGWQRCPREVSRSRSSDWGWCSGDSGLTPYPFCRLSQRDEWHWTDLQQDFLTTTVAHMQPRSKTGIPAYASSQCLLGD